ncbi:MAG: tRNA preQ1(34) S-adenosylmethionine ribosyltransferase-isomerase QueA [Patescibacteria group bacterium]
MTTTADTSPDLYAYDLPPSAIAEQPPEPRDAARLLVYHRQTGQVTLARFRDLPKILPAKSTLVLNDTKVIPARLWLTSEAGKAVEILYLKSQDSHIWALANKRLLPRTKIFRNEKHLFTVTKQEGKEYQLEPAFPIDHLSQILEQYGTTPLPPYLRHSPLTEEERRIAYQTVFAAHSGSVAAPTASLHFTPGLLHNLRSRGLDIQYVTLHVNQGTFAPLTAEQLKRHELHQEEYEVSEATATALNAAKAAGRPVVAVGTTVVRTLEAAAKQNGTVTPKRSLTKLFIAPGYHFKTVDHLITNFHVPESSLMMLAAAFTGREKLHTLYQQALAHDFKFLSFGDGMLVI